MIEKVDFQVIRLPKKRQVEPDVIMAPTRELSISREGEINVGLADLSGTKKFARPRATNARSLSYSSSFSRINFQSEATLITRARTITLRCREKNYRPLNENPSTSIIYGNEKKDFLASEVWEMLSD